VCKYLLDHHWVFDTGNHSDGTTACATVPALPSGTQGMDYECASSDPFRVYSVSEDNRVDVFQAYTDY
jgi:hypothetical protein